jgi:hypothetical protein
MRKDYKGKEDEIDMVDNKLVTHIACTTGSGESIISLGRHGVPSRIEDLLSTY